MDFLDKYLVFGVTESLPAMPESLLGKKLDGRYRVTRSLAVGGFGQTYIAEDTRRPGHPQCVVKLLKPACNDPKFLENTRRLFIAEAETLERLGNHEQVPRLLAHFIEGEDFYLVQEYIEGSLLTEELFPGECWPLQKVARLIREVLQILRFIHSQDVIHRDIKPDNLIRRYEDNRLVLVDFGTVKQIQTRAAIPGQSMATISVGTPGYMPTEQSHGKPRVSSDIYALGVIAIQAITGLRPSQMEEDEESGELVWLPWAECDPGLTRIIGKMVRYHFRDRYKSASAALQDLDLYIESYPELAEAIFPAAAESEPKSFSVLPENLTLWGADDADEVAASEQASQCSTEGSVTAGKSHETGDLPTSLLLRAQASDAPRTKAQAPGRKLEIPSQILSRRDTVPVSATDEPLLFEFDDVRRKGPSRKSASNRSVRSVSKKGMQKPSEKGERLRHHRARLALAGVTVAGLLTIGGLGLQNRNAFETAEQALAQAQQFQNSEDYGACVNTAQTVSRRYSWVHGNARDLMGICLFLQAEEFAAGYRFKDAIAVAQKITDDMSAYQEAQAVIPAWSEEILQIALNNYKLGQYEAAQSIIQSIPKNSEIGDSVAQTLDTWRTEWQKNNETLTAAQTAVDQQSWQQALNEADKITLMGESVSEGNPYWKERLQPIVSEAEAGLTAAAEEAARRAARAAARAAARESARQAAIVERRRQAVQVSAPSSPATPTYSAPAAYTPAPTYNPAPASRSGWRSEQR